MGEHYNHHVPQPNGPTANFSPVSEVFANPISGKVAGDTGEVLPLKQIKGTAIDNALRSDMLTTKNGWSKPALKTHFYLQSELYGRSSNPFFYSIASDCSLITLEPSM